MVRYRRNFVSGATYFFTATLADRNSEALTQNIGCLRESLRAARQVHPFQLDAIVVLPDHLHTVMTLPDGDQKYPQRWMLIKRRFTERLAKRDHGVPRRANGEYAL